MPSGPCPCLWNMHETFFVNCAMVKFTNMSYVSKVDTVSVFRVHKSVTVVMILLSSESNLVIHLILL